MKRKREKGGEKGKGMARERLVRLGKGCFLRDGEGR